VATLPTKEAAADERFRCRRGPTLAVQRFFDPLLQSGDYIVIEDANMTEIGTDAGHDGGPARAISEFLGTRGSDYVIDDRYCDLYGFNVTENPNGYLRKK
jgi:cephalosporin hydroxylase